MKITIDTTEKTIQVSGSFKVSEFSELINNIGADDYTIIIPIHDVKIGLSGPTLQGNKGLELSDGTFLPTEAVKMPIISATN